MPLNGVSDFTAICKQCQMFDLLDEVEKAVHNFHIYGECHFCLRGEF